MTTKQFLFLISTFIFSFSTSAEQFQEGKHYTALPNQVTATKEITEFFSFYCPACYRQEPFMNSIKASLPSGATFKKNHVDGMPGRDKATEQQLTKALITAKLLKVEEKIVPAIFNHIHVNKAGFNGEQDVKNLFLTNGIDDKAFDKTYKSFAVATQAKRMQKNTSAIRSNGFSGVPTLLINGKYVPLIKSIKSVEQYKDIVMFLLNKTS